MRMEKGIIVGAGLGLVLLAVAGPAAADNYHYHELITPDATSRYTAWTGYPEHAATMDPAYDPAALGLTLLPPDSEGRVVVAGSESSTAGNNAFCKAGDCGSSWVDFLTWQHTFDGLPHAEAIRWVRFEIKFYQERDCGSSGSGCSGHHDKDKHDDHEHEKDSGNPPASYSFSDLLDFSDIDLDSPDTPLESQLAGAGVTDELRDRSPSSGPLHRLDYKKFSYAGLPISVYLDADLVFAGQPFAFDVTLSSSTGKFCVASSEFIVDYIPSPVPEPATLAAHGVRPRRPGPPSPASLNSFHYA